MSSLKGTIAKWNSDKGFGFVKAEDGREAFLHWTEITPRQPRGTDLSGQAVVVGSILKGDRGLKATGVILVSTSSDMKFEIVWKEGYKPSEEVQQQNEEVLWSKGRSAGTRASSRAIEESYNADQAPWPAARVYYYSSGTGRTKSETWVKKGSGIKGLIAATNEEEMFYFHVLAVGYSQLDATEAIVVVRPGHTGQAIGTGGRRIKFAQETLGIGIKIVEPEELYVKTRMVVSEDQMNWSVQATGFMKINGKEIQLGPWGHPEHWRLAIGMPTQLPLCSISGDEYGTKTGVKTWKTEIGGKETSFFIGINFQLMLDYLHDSNFVDEAFLYVLNQVVPLWNCPELGIKFEEMRLDLKASATMPTVKKAYFNEEGEFVVITSQDRTLTSLVVKNVLATSTRDFTGESWTIRITVEVPEVHRGEYTLEVRGKEHESAGLVRRRYWQYTSQYAEEQERLVREAAARAAYELEHANDPHEVIDVYGSYYKLNWGERKQEQGKIGKLNVWFAQDGSVDSMEFVPTVDLQHNPQYKQGQGQFKISEKRAAYYPGGVDYQVVDQSDRYSTKITVQLGDQELKVRVGGQKDETRLYKAALAYQKQLNNR